MKLKYYNGAGPVSFWGPNWTDTYSPDLVVTGYEVAFIDGFDVLLVEYVDFSDFSYKYFAFVIDETYYDYQLEGIIVIEKDLFGNVNPLFILEDFSFSSSTLDGLFANAYIAISDFRNLTRFSDIIEGNDYSNRLEAGRGNDTIYGNGGNDFIFDDAGNDLYFGGSGSDTFYATNTFSGINKVYGGSGSDYLYIDPDLRVTRAVDTFGDYFTKGTEYIVVQNNSGSSIMRASSIEFIQENNGPVASVSSYNYDFFYYVLLNSNIPNKNYSSSQWSESNIFIDLDDYLASINYEETTKYSISLSNSAYLDQFSISNNQLKIENGSGTTRTVDVTVSAVNVTSNGNVRNNDVATTDVFTVTFKDNNSSSSAYSGTSGNDTRTLTSGNDSWQVGKGYDVVDGGLGTDTLIVPDEYYVVSAIDIKGNYTGNKGEPFTYIGKDSDLTIALNFEEINFNGNISSLSSFRDTTRFNVSSSDIPNKTVSNNSSTTINLADYFWSLNAKTDRMEFEILEIDNKNFNDQIKLTGSSLKLTSGLGGDQENAEITIRATQKFSDDWIFSREEGNYKDQTFTVSMTDLYDKVRIKDNIHDQDLSFKSSNLKINLDNYFGPSSGYSIQYEITSIESQNYTSINGNILTVFTREDAYETIPITVSARNLNYDGKTISGDDPISQTFYITFAPDIIGTDDDDNIVGSSGNDIFNVTDGYDLLDGGSGVDILVIPDNSEVNLYFKDENYNLESYMIIKGIDIDGSITGEINKDFLTLLKVLDINSPAIIDENFTLSDGDKYINLTYAFNFEKIYYENVLYDYEDFISNGNWTLGNRPELVMVYGAFPDDWYPQQVIKIPDQKISNSSSKTINLVDYFRNANADLDLKFELVSVENDKLSDQINLNGSNLIIKSGSSGDLISSKVTITGKLKYDSSGIRGQSEDYFNYYSVGGPDNIFSDINDGEVNPSSSNLKILYTRTFEVTMTDDDYTDDLSSSEDNGSYRFSSIKNENGPNLSAFSSTSTSSGTLNHSSNSEIIVLTGQAGTIRGLAGDDTYFISDLITANSSISIVDTSGDNIIQIPDNTLIEKALFASSATRLTLSNDSEITINGADKFTFNISGNSIAGDKGENFSYSDFVKLFGTELSSQTQTKEGTFYTKSDSTSSSSFNIINISGSEDASFIATTAADEFRYEINNDGTSAEGPYTFEIEDFDKTNDKLVLVNKTGSSELTTQEFDSLDNVEVTSDGISGTQILFAPDNSGQSGKLTIKDVDESFSGNWTTNTYDVEIIPTSSLSSASNETSYKLSSSTDGSDPVLEEFNSTSFSGTLNYSSQNDLIILTGSGETARGLGGDDTYFVSNLIPKNSKISIVDTNGKNTIQIPDNTFVSETLFTKNATRLTLNDDKEITISNADTFNFNLGGNKTTGDPGAILNYEEFASAFGVEDVLSLGSSVNGTIVDQYII